MSFDVVLVVPTGLGAEIGGFAGDATPVANLLAGVADRLITHPNVVNAATLYAARPNVWYVEGGMLDRFCLGQLSLSPARSNPLGLLIDRAVGELDPAGLDHLLNAAEAIRAVHGLEIVGWRSTGERVRSRIVLGPGGVSHGELDNPATLLEGARALAERGARAIALVTRMPEVPASAELAYLAGSGPDPIGGLEAILSRLVGQSLDLPCAHAPYEPLEPTGRVDPRLAAEQIGTTYLPCVLVGLARAPRPAAAAAPEALAFSGVSAVVAPWGACGGVPVLAAARAGVPIVAVEGNPVRCGVSPEALGLKVRVARSYLEAAGMLVAMREGLALESLQRPLARLVQLDAEASTP